MFSMPFRYLQVVEVLLLLAEEKTLEQRSTDDIKHEKSGQDIIKSSYRGLSSPRC